MKTIIVSTDFSAAARNAGEYAADMAKAIHAELLLFTVFELPVTYYEVPVAMTTVEMTEVEEKNIVALKNDLIARTGNQVIIRTEVRLGSYFDELKSVCQLIKPYAVVMGSQGTTAAERILFGSHTVNAMKHLNWPLIAVPPKVKFSSVKKICMACDLRNVLNSIPVDEIRALVIQFQAELHIVNTGKKGDFNERMLSESALLQKMFVDLKPEYHFLTSKDIDQGVIDFCEANEIDLLLILPKRHSFLEKLIFKSHTKQLVLHSHVPVMALH